MECGTEEKVLLAYSDEDMFCKEFVWRELLTLVEGKLGIKCILRDRDMVAGQHKHKQFCEWVSRCRVTFIPLCQSFIDEYLDFVDCRQPGVVVIKIEDIPLPANLKNIDIIDYTDPGIRMFFEKKIENTLQTLFSLEAVDDLGGTQDVHVHLYTRDSQIAHRGSGTGRLSSKESKKPSMSPYATGGRSPSPTEITSRHIPPSLPPPILRHPSGKQDREASSAAVTFRPTDSNVSSTERDESGDERDRRSTVSSLDGKPSEDQHNPTATEEGISFVPSVETGGTLDENPQHVVMMLPEFMGTGFGECIYFIGDCLWYPHMVKQITK